jgi:hypothetical protein
MYKYSLSAAVAGALALACASAPAAAYDETPQAVAEATTAADLARADMMDEFGRDTLANGRFLWDGDGHTVDRVVVDLSAQMAYAYAGDRMIGVSTISSGTAKTPTPVGIFPILAKARDYRSRKYDNAPMPFMQRLDDFGIALHAGALPGRPASHGCVRLPHQFAAKLFAATRVGTTVMIGA